MSPLKKAQKRLASFMKKENASLADCAKILLIDESNLSCFMEQTAAFSRYTETVLKCFGSDNNKRNLAKLQDIQGSQANPRFKGAAEKKHIQGLPYKAMNVLAAFMAKFGFNDATASKALGWSVGNICQLRMQFDSGNMGDRAARSLMKRIDNYNHEAANQPVSDKPETSHQDEPVHAMDSLENNETLPELARRMFALYRVGQANKLTYRDAVEVMNTYRSNTTSRTFQSHTLSSAFSPSMIKSMSREHAEDILITLAACPWTTFPSELALYQNLTSNVYSEGEGAPKDKATPIIDEIRELLSTHFETQTGYSIREIQDAANEIDLILCAKRAGASIRVTTDLSS